MVVRHGAGFALEQGKPSIIRRYKSVNASFRSLESILEGIPPQPEHLINALQQVQAKFDYISEEALEMVCDHVGVSKSRGWAVATFYRFFNLQPRKEKEVKVCMGTACHVRGAAKVYDKLSRDLPEKDATGQDSGYSLHKVYCLGCCSMGPVATVNDEIHGNLDQKKAGALIKTSTKG